MSLRPPSLQQPYDMFFSGDPSIIPLPADLEKRPERERLLQVARDTGDWTPIVLPNERPARFVMKPLTGNVYREIADAAEAGKIRSGKLAQLAFRAAIQNVVDPELGDVPIKFEPTDRFGDIATVAIADFFDGIDLSIVTELGGYAMRRARDLSPKR